MPRTTETAVLSGEIDYLNDAIFAAIAFQMRRNITCQRGLAQAKLPQ